MEGSLLISFARNAKKNARALLRSTGEVMLTKIAPWRGLHQGRTVF
jgi:hypothetical protein